MTLCTDISTQQVIGSKRGNSDDGGMSSVDHVTSVACNLAISLVGGWIHMGFLQSLT